MNDIGLAIVGGAIALVTALSLRFAEFVLTRPSTTSTGVAARGPNPGLIALPSPLNFQQRAGLPRRSRRGHS